MSCIFFSYIWPCHSPPSILDNNSPNLLLSFRGIVFGFDQKFLCSFCFQIFQMVHWLWAVRWNRLWLLPSLCLLPDQSFILICDIMPYFLCIQIIIKCLMKHIGDINGRKCFSLLGITVASVSSKWSSMGCESTGAAWTPPACRARSSSVAARFCGSYCRCGSQHTLSESSQLVTGCPTSLGEIHRNLPLSAASW